MTRKELQEVKAEYRKKIRQALYFEKDISNYTVDFCQSLATEMCYNHHERGQRLWAFFEAFKEVEEG